MSSDNALGSNHEAEVLALDQEIFAASHTLSRWVGGQHESLAESALRLLAVFSVANSSADQDEDGHVLDSHLGGGLQSAAGQSGGVCWVDNLAVV